MLLASRTGKSLHLFFSSFMGQRESDRLLSRSLIRLKYMVHPLLIPVLCFCTISLSKAIPGNQLTAPSRLDRQRTEGGGGRLVVRRPAHCLKRSPFAASCSPSFFLSPLLHTWHVPEFTGSDLSCVAAGASEGREVGIEETVKILGGLWAAVPLAQCPGFVPSGI